MPVARVAVVRRATNAASVSTKKAAASVDRAINFNTDILELIKILESQP